MVLNLIMFSAHKAEDAALNNAGRSLEYSKILARIFILSVLKTTENQKVLNQEGAISFELLPFELWLI